MSNERRDEILQKGKLHATPELVIEILSPGTENIRRDRIAKRQLYAKYGVEEYWVIDAQMRTLEVYRLRDALLDLIAMHAKGDTVTTALLPDWSMSIEELFAV
ncbi:MAG: Uma2 family endonuclease [Pyrinomonadaceae bacterium MAG19_C2-C3]|nr:Uma2 family endonuclease [Pyrinomonadaceae bacterium MAG19_C2-C3]